MTSANAPIDHIVLGVDNGDYSWEALDLAREVAEGVGANLGTFHATESKVPDDVVNRAFNAGVDLKTVVTVGGNAGVSSALIDYVDGLDNAVIALTSHARRGLSAALLGSTAATVLEQATTPVLLFGPHHGEPASTSRVLACLDGSDLSETILPAACRWARAADVPLWLVHVVEPDAMPPGGIESNYVDRIAESLDVDDLDIEFDVLHGTHPGKSIAEYAELRPGTLTALATHGRSGVRQITMGSVAMEVTRRSTGPTLVVRPS